MMIIYIAGIQNIPGELIEAAKIDGANSWQLLRYVTLPMLMPTITICTFLTLTNGFKLFSRNILDSCNIDNHHISDLLPAYYNNHTPERIPLCGYDCLGEIG